MPSLILSREFDDIVFLRFNEKENFESVSLDKFFNDIKNIKRKYIIVDFGSCCFVKEETLLEIVCFANEISSAFFWNLCFSSQNEKVFERIKIVCSNMNLKYFHNINDAINYFLWDCGKIREVLSMKMPSDISLVPSVRACISDFVSLCKADRKMLFQLELIVDELCNNAIEHGTQDFSKTIEVLCSINEEQVEIVVYNGYSSRAAKNKTGHEIGKDMEKWAETPNQTEDTFRGRGLGLVKKYSDNFEINSSNDGTWVYVLKKKEV